MHTGQPGPMMTFKSRGNAARRPKRAMACSWLPQTCMTETPGRPMSLTTRASASASALPRPASRNFISRTPASRSSAIARLPGGVQLALDVGRHQVLRLGAAEDLVEERKRVADLVLGNAVD